MILGINHSAHRPALSGGTATPPRGNSPTLPRRAPLLGAPVLRLARQPQQLCLDLQPRRS